MIKVNALDLTMGGGGGEGGGGDGVRIKVMRTRVYLKAAAEDEDSGLPEGSCRGLFFTATAPAPLKPFNGIQIRKKY